ncbi:MAG: esterase-like activity of phytase family protein [Actinobacteria bacterium]|nr:esterase-like activity of phytase family protein [Actinomycetota bacterium]
MNRNRILALALAACALGACIAAAAASAHHVPRHWHHHPSPPPHHPCPLTANPDTYSTAAGQATLAVEGQWGVLANDCGNEPTIVANTEPTSGSLELEPDGGFTYTPNAGFEGTDSFSYTIADAVHAYKTHLPPIGSYEGVPLAGGAFGSSVPPVPRHPEEIFGLEDRAPNVEAPGGVLTEPKPSYDPAIARFVLDEGEAELVEKIPLRDKTGHSYSGLVNSLAPTNETIQNLKGVILPHDPDGYDPEGLVAMPDGSFWVSDEYGPFITHFNSEGREISRLSPYDGSLPAELQKRVPNRGMEGLTITPDGRTLVGMMQSALQQTDLPVEGGKAYDAKKLVPTRIVTYGLYTHQVHEYLFLLDEPASLKTANSEITAISNNTFLIDERDGNFPSATGYKKLWKVSLEGATDVGPSAHVSGATYDAAAGGLLIGGKTIEATVVGQKTAEAKATIEGEGIKPVSASLYLDVDALLTQLNPADTFFDHDKVEGVVALEGGKRLIISNDNDFGIAGAEAAPAGSPNKYKLVAKLLPGLGIQDEGEYLEVNVAALPAATSSTTVTINVGEAH